MLAHNTVEACVCMQYFQKLLFSSLMGFPKVRKNIIRTLHIGGTLLLSCMSNSLLFVPILLPIQTNHWLVDGTHPQGCGSMCLHAIFSKTVILILYGISYSKKLKIIWTLYFGCTLFLSYMSGSILFVPMLHLIQTNH